MKTEDEQSETPLKEDDNELSTEKMTKKIVEYLKTAWAVIVLFLWAYFFGWIDWGFWWIISPMWIPIALFLAVAMIVAILYFMYWCLNKVKWFFINLKERLDEKKELKYTTTDVYGNVIDDE